MSNPEPLQTLAEQSAPKLTYLAAGMLAGLGAWGVQEWAVLVGAIIAVLTYATTLVFQIRRDRRGQAELNIRRREHEQHENAQDRSQE